LLRKKFRRERREKPRLQLVRVDAASGLARLRRRLLGHDRAHHHRPAAHSRRRLSSASSTTVSDCPGINLAIRLWRFQAAVAGVAAGECLALFGLRIAGLVAAPRPREEDGTGKMDQQEDSEATVDLKQTFCFDFLSGPETTEAASHSNQSNRTDIMKKYLVYMELPKIRIGDYRKSSCVSGNVIRFHFLLRIARDEENMVLRLQPIKAYKTPVVNFAVIHRPFLDDDSAKGPIPKSPGVRSPLINYEGEETSPGVPDSRTDDIIEDFQSDKAQAPSVDDEQKQQGQRRSSDASIGKSQPKLKESPKRRSSQASIDKDKVQQKSSESPKRRSSQASIDKDKVQQKSSESPKRRSSQASIDKDKVQQKSSESPKRRSSQASIDKAQQEQAKSPQKHSSSEKTQTQPSESPKRRSSQASTDEQQRLEVEAPVRRPSQTSLDQSKMAIVDQRRSSQSSTGAQQQRFEVEAPVRRPSQASEDLLQQAGAARQQESQTSSENRTGDVSTETCQGILAESPKKARLEIESPTPRQDISPARLLSDDNATTRTDTTGRQKQRRPKKYFVYCEIPKILLGDYRNSSVICSEIIHAHFLMKIAKDEESNQPRLKPIKRYHRPKVNFAVIHRSLLVDDDAIGPIPRSPNVRSPMIREDEPEEEDDVPPDNVMHATMGFCYGRLPRSKYELITQWSLVNGDGGGPPLPELVLSKADLQWLTKQHDQRHLIRASLLFCFKLGNSAAEVHRKLCQACAEDFLSDQRCHVWFAQFKKDVSILFRRSSLKVSIAFEQRLASNFVIIGLDGLEAPFQREHVAPGTLVTSVVRGDGIDNGVLGNEAAGKEHSAGQDQQGGEGVVLLGKLREPLHPQPSRRLHRLSPVVTLRARGKKRQALKPNFFSRQSSSRNNCLALSVRLLPFLSSCDSGADRAGCFKKQNHSVLRNARPAAAANDAASKRSTSPMPPVRNSSGGASGRGGGGGGGGITEEVDVVFLESLDKKYECPVCGQVLRYPVQFEECGHRCCSSCLPDLLRVAPRCPIDQQTIDKDKVYADKAFQKETDSLGSHIEGCDRMLTTCPMRCGVEFQKRFLEKHRLEDCPKRDIQCQFCEIGLVAEQEAGHLETCPKFLVPCPNKCKKKEVAREMMQEHLENECMRQDLCCPFSTYGCDFSGRKKQLKEHIAEKQLNHMEILCSAVKQGDKNQEKQQKQILEMEKKLVGVERRVGGLENLFGPQLVWRIDNYQEKLAEAKAGKKATIFSPPFLTNRHGYKLALSACLYGDGKFRGQYMSLFACICKGENDALLAWPFAYKLTFQLIDQCEDVSARKNIVYTVTPNPCKENRPFLGRPLGERNASFGAARFAELDAIGKLDYIKDDTMYVKVTVDLENLLPLKNRDYTGTGTGNRDRDYI
uniref:HTH_48 domain-containing protein n=1 Tax=Macrostomum lignano TaxID=282301 RepID=A0A1I8GCA6_9PLAT